MSRASKAEKLNNFLKDLESQPEEEAKEVLREKLNRLQQDKEALTLQVPSMKVELRIQLNASNNLSHTVTLKAAKSVSYK